MICVDRIFLVDMWRTKDLFDSPVRDFLVTHSADEFVVPVHAAGAFLECCASISATRLKQAESILGFFRIGCFDFDTARRYAAMVSALRRGSTLGKRSKTDLWIAAWAIQHSATLVTRDKIHFRDIPDLRLASYLSL
jgi:predicted nucleic acid-binding protein